MSMMTRPPLDGLLDQTSNVIREMLVPHSEFVEGPQPMESKTASTVENQQVEEPQTSRFTWTIENFSRLKTKELYSELFAAGGCKWRVLIFPKGNEVKYLSVYLDVADSPTLPYAQFSLSVVNQIHRNYTIRKDTERGFNAEESDWGFTSFMLLSDLNDPSNGFLVNDTCVIEADVAVLRVIGYRSNDSKEETDYVGLKTEKTSLEMPIHLSEGEDNEENTREESKTARTARRKSRAQKGKYDKPPFDAPLSSSGTTDSSHQSETTGTSPPPPMTPEKPGADKSSPNVVATSEYEISKSQADIYEPLATIPTSTRPFSAPLVSEILPSTAATTLLTSTTPTSSSTSLVKDLLLRGQNLRAAILKKPTATQPAIAPTPAPPLSEDQVQARQLLSCLRTSSFRAAISQQKAIEDAVSLLSDFAGFTSSPSSSTFIEQFREIANTLAESTIKIAEADKFFKRKEEVTQQVTNLADFADAMVKDSSSISDAIKKKQAELKALQEAYDAQQTELEKIPPQLDPLLDELSTIDVQELNWVSTQQTATNAISQIDEQWNQALALLAPFFT